MYFFEAMLGSAFQIYIKISLNLIDSIRNQFLKIYAEKKVSESAQR